MVNISKDGEGKTRVAKGDQSGLGGQFAPDVNKLSAAKNKLEGLKETLSDDVKKVKPPTQAELRKKLEGKNFVGLAETIVKAKAEGDTALSGAAMQMAERKGIWEETLEAVTLFKREGRFF
jgi:hypothetical protein